MNSGILNHNLHLTMFLPFQVIMLRTTSEQSTLLSVSDWLRCRYCPPAGVSGLLRCNQRPLVGVSDWSWCLERPLVDEEMPNIIYIWWTRCICLFKSICEYDLWLQMVQPNFFLRHLIKWSSKVAWLTNIFWQRGQEMAFMTPLSKPAEAAPLWAKAVALTWWWKAKLTFTSARRQNDILFSLCFHVVDLSDFSCLTDLEKHSCIVYWRTWVARARPGREQKNWRRTE